VNNRKVMNHMKVNLNKIQFFRSTEKKKK